MDLESVAVVIPSRAEESTWAVSADFVSSDRMVLDPPLGETGRKNFLLHSADLKYSVMTINAVKAEHWAKNSRTKKNAVNEFNVDAEMEAAQARKMIHNKTTTDRMTNCLAMRK